MSESGSPSRSRPKIRWWLAGVLTVSGIVVIAVGYGFAHGWVVGSATDESYASGVAVNIGTSLLLAAALVLFERALVFTAERAVERAAIPIRAEAAAARAESQFVRQENLQLTERTATLEARLLDLDDQLRARTNAETQEQANTFASLAETVNRETVMEIMDAASRINALDAHSETGRSGRITVPAGEGLEAPRIAIEYATFDEDNWNTQDIPDLRLVVIGMEDEMIAWEVDAEPLELFSDIRSLMIRRGEARRTGPLSPTTFFSRLRTAVQEAVLSRTANPTGWLTTTPVLEMIANDWMITNGGIEVRGHGIVIRRDQYPHSVPGGQRTSYRVGPAPEYLDSATWDFAAERGGSYFTGPIDEPWGSPPGTPF